MQCFATRWPRCRNSFRPLSDAGRGFAPQISQKIAAVGGPALSQSTTDASATYGALIGLLSSATSGIACQNDQREGCEPDREIVVPAPDGYPSTFQFRFSLSFAPELFDSVRKLICAENEHKVSGHYGWS